MDNDIIMHPANTPAASGRPVPDSLIAKLSITTGAPSSGLLSDTEVVRLSEAEIEAALEEIRARFRDVTTQSRENPDDRHVRRTLAQLALNRRILDEERQKRIGLRATG